MTHVPMPEPLGLGRKALQLYMSPQASAREVMQSIARRALPILLIQGSPFGPHSSEAIRDFLRLHAQRDACSA